MLDIRGVRTLGTILAERVGAVVNRTSLASDLAVAPDTVKAWIGLLESVYYCFLVHPWSRHVANAIRKQPNLSAPYAIQVAMDGEQSGVDVLDFKGQAIKVSVHDFLCRLV